MNEPDVGGRGAALDAASATDMENLPGDDPVAAEVFALSPEGEMPVRSVEERGRRGPGDPRAAGSAVARGAEGAAGSGLDETVGQLAVVIADRVTANLLPAADDIAFSLHGGLVNQDYKHSAQTESRNHGYPAEADNESIGYSGETKDIPPSP